MLEINKAHLIDVVDGLKQLDDESADIIIADPPYNIGKDFGNSKTDMSMDEYVTWCMQWINESIRVLKQTGTMFVYGLSEQLAYLSVNIPLEKRWLIWHYTNKTIPRANFWQRSHESIIVTWKNDRIFNRDDVREPYTETFLKMSAGKVRTSTKGRFSDGNKETIYKAHTSGALPRDVIKISALAGGAGKRERWFYCKDCLGTFFPEESKDHIGHNIIKHPTQKPLALTYKLLLSCKPQNDGLVVIPFIGSGSEAHAVYGSEMNFIGFDINEDYVNMSNSLIERQISFNSTLKHFVSMIKGKELK
jgi:site-specific DNA-methyltransferase (adenine-specific)